MVKTTYKMQKNEITNHINQAFAHVCLGNGIGFLEADCVDDHLPPEHPERQQCRAQDRQHHWRDILAWIDEKPLRARFHPYSAFTFMDNAGRRFALPCYLLWQLHNHPLAPELDDILSDYTLHTLELDSAQQHAVRRVIDTHGDTQLAEQFNRHFPPTA